MSVPRSRVIEVAWVAVAVVGLYLLAAYVILPAMWSHYERQPGLAARPMVTHTRQGIPGDPVNVGLVGSRVEVVRAMAAAGWHPADPVTLESAVEIGIGVVLNRPYQDAPVSTLLYQGRPQDLAFEKPFGGSPARRHHVRLWLTLSNGTEGREVWLGAASFDRSVGLSHDTGQITHHIDPDLDAERAFFILSLSGVGAVAQTYEISGIGPTLNGRNGEGDRYFTDGEVVIGVIRPTFDAGAPTVEVLPSPMATAIKGRAWPAVVAVGRFLRILPRSHRQRG